MGWIPCAVTVVVFWTIAVPAVGKLCGKRSFCRISELDINSTPEGLNVLAEEPSAFYTSIQIQQLVMDPTTVATLLINASALTSNLLLKKYHEKMLLLPSAHTLEVLTLQEARYLQMITIQTNRHLKQLDITQCAISIVPPSIRNIISLRELQLKFCAIKTLNLALLATLKHLQTAQFMGNNVTIINAPQASIVPSIRTVDLSYNNLRQIDLSSLKRLKLLDSLNLAHNQLSSVEYPAVGVVTLPSLTLLYLSNNRLEQISFLQLNASSLEYLMLSFNRLASIPEHIDKFPKLAKLALSNNGFETFDFAILKRLTNLQWLELDNNRLRSIDLPRGLVLPNLSQLTLADNQLKSVALEQLTAPRLGFLDLRSNLLMAIPNVFEKDVMQLQYVNVMDNPLACGTYAKYRKYIRLGILVLKWATEKEALCSTGKYFILTKTQRVCCLMT